MLGSIYIGLSGLGAFSKGLQTISNNVANLNTPGFKASSLSFTDILGHGGGSFIGSAFGQGGAGVRFDGSGLDFRQGNLRQTNRELDLAMQGNGFMALLKDGTTYYARTGQFTAGEDGFITEASTGYRLAVLNEARELIEVNVDSKRVSLPVATTRVSFSENLAAGGTMVTIPNISIIDSRGGTHNWIVTLEPVASTPGEWTVKVTDQHQTVLRETTVKAGDFFMDPVTSKFTVTATPSGADPLSVEFDLSAVRSLSGNSTIKASSINGEKVGSLVNVSIDDDGRVKLTYSNQKTEILGPVALADFRDLQQLEAVGNGVFVNRMGVEARFFASGSEGEGKLLSGQVEGSNVDLSQQFGDLILIQRGFQASSQVVSVSNDMIQQLFGMRGQG